MDSQSEIEALALILASKINQRTAPAPALGELFDQYMDLYARPHLRSWRNSQRCFNCYLTEWNDRPVNKITASEVAALHAKLGAGVGKTTANRVIELLQSIYNRSRELNLISCPNPAAGIKKFSLISRDRFFTQDELKRLFAAIDTLRYPVTRDFLMLCLFVPARRSNIAALRWEHVDLTNRLVYFSGEEVKNGCSLWVPLVDESLGILARRLNHRQADSPWVFPSERSRCGHLTKPEEAWKAVVDRAGLQNARMHDLRRTHASYQAIGGENLSIIAATLGHKDIKSTSIYARLNLDAVRRAMERAAKRMNQ